jgi:ribosomal protein S18 acetylase RimI-like enzyme
MAERKSVEIRRMEVADIPAVYRLGADTFTAEKWPMLYRNWDEYEVTGLFNTDGDYCLVAESAEEELDRIRGFVLGTVISKPGSAWTYGYILWLCVRAGWQREGVASRLVDKLVETMIEEEGIRIIMSDTDPENERAVRFFERMGFDDRKAHVYLSSNVEQNPRYMETLEATRAAASPPDPPPKKRRRRRKTPPLPP